MAILPENIAPLPVTLILWLLAGVGQNRVNLSTETLLAERTEEAAQDRGYGAHFAWSHLWYALTYPLAGWLGTRAPQAELLAGGGLASVLPFGNTVTTRTVTGTQLYAVLENSVSALPGSSGRFLQISGFSYTYDVSKPVGSRVVGVKLDSGAAIGKDSATYTLALPDFTNEGGDGYTMLADGQGVTREPDALVLLNYVQKLGSITPTVGQRINAVK